MSRVNKVSAADSKARPYLETTDHPLLETKDLKSETCLKCHPTKIQGKFVHTAVRMGCENCHQVVTSDSQTAILLQATGGNLCAKCHEINKNSVLHGPYQAGECLVCHSPHTTDFPAQTRAAGNTLCLSCHMLNQPEVHVNGDGKTVTLLDGRVYDLASWQGAPKVSARHGQTGLSPKPGSEISGKKTENNDPEANCLSCHAPHGSQNPNLIRSLGGEHGVSENNAMRDKRKFTAMCGIATIAFEPQGPVFGGRS
jgi:predicted CXXCH cytochrome family protein